MRQWLDGRLGGRLSRRLGEWLGEGVRAAADLGPLLRFRSAAVRGRARRAAPLALGVIVLLTVATAVGPAFVQVAAIPRRDVLLLLPSTYLAVLVLAVVSVTTSGGGRELLPRDQAVAYPVSATTDHLGALLMAPLNITWLLQCWTALATTSYAVGARPTLGLALLPVLVWLLAATAVAQALAWGLEWVRRGAHGLLVVRATAALLAAAGALLVATHRLAPLLDRSPTMRLAMGVLAGADGRWWPWARMVAGLLLLTAVAVGVGGWAAGRVSRRPPRDELGLDSAHHPARALPRSDLAALVRTDRASVYRSLPMRRGVAVLAALPGGVAMLSGFGWDMLSIFPGLVSSGAALLFGVNAWSLDGRGTLWRESLPVTPRLAFAARALVLVELMLAATGATLLMASLRAGTPTSSQLVAVVCASVVVTVQVTATSLRWSVWRPYEVDLRSARATPAPPLVMVGYSSRLALSTTTTGLLFNVAATASWGWPVLLAVPFLAWSAVRLRRAARAWEVAETRARVVVTVAS